MSNYTLTTDLVSDCMALIPHNLELLNETAGHPIHFADYSYRRDFANATDLFQFLIISHCLRVIPEFQAKSSQYSEKEDKYNRYVEYLFRNQIRRRNDEQQEKLEKLSDLVCLTPKTIASATLHGQGEFPPSTLEELCESYKNVMSK